MIRAFIAANLALSIVEEIAKVQGLLRSAPGDIRWTRIAGWHLTFKFLGDIARNQPGPIMMALHAALQEQSAVPVRVQGLGAFPNLKRPRVLWTALQGDGLQELAEKMETALISLDFPPEERPFTPHLTLGRVRSLRGWEQVLAVVRQHERQFFGESQIEQVTLYQSELKPAGAIYTSLGTVALRRKR